MRLSDVAQDRALTAAEYELVEWLLEHGTSSTQDYKAQLESLWVVAKCSCGCASIDFSVDGKVPESTSRMDVLSDFCWETDSGALQGCFLFARGNQLAGLELWSVDGIEVASE